MYKVDIDPDAGVFKNLREIADFQCINKSKKCEPLQEYCTIKVKFNT